MNFLIFKENRDVLIEILPRFLFASLGFYFIERGIFNQIIFKLLKYSAIITFLIVSLQPFVNDSIIFNYNSIGSTSSGYMNFGYTLLPSVIICLMTYIKEKKKIYFLISFLGIFLIIVFGSRGSIFSLLVFIFLYIFIYSNFKMRILYLLMLSFSIFLVLYLVLPNLNSIIDFLVNHDIESDFLDRVINGEILINNRQDIYNILIQNMKNNVFLGSGIGGDRVLIARYWYSEAYAHNIILEILTQFGLFLGLFSILLFIILTVKKSVNMTKNNRLLFIALLSVSIPKLFFSSSFWYESYFFALLGFIVLINKKEVAYESSNNML
jgi:O-antigen ligase